MICVKKNALFVILFVVHISLFLHE